VQLESGLDLVLEAEKINRLQPPLALAGSAATR
jgi:hypothetical protein